MTNIRSAFSFKAVVFIAGSVLAGSAMAALKAPLIIQDQGSFMAGGTMRVEDGKFDPYHQANPAGQTYHGDHAYVFYQIPEHPHQYPIVMLHGAGQFSKTWETTPDGREGFQTIFLRNGYSTYLVDQPRRGNAGRSMETATLKPTGDEQMVFDQTRLGVWPEYFKGVQFAHDPQTLNQYFRQMTPNTGPFDLHVIANAMSAVFDKTGPAIFFTHSQGGGVGWLTATKNKNVKAIVAFEPGSSFAFPAGEVPEPIKNKFDIVKGESVSKDDFMALTRIPILVLYGDNIPDKPTALPAQDSWRARLEMARKWRDKVNQYGGHVELVHLPEIGIHGNTHFLFSDLNNQQIADLVNQYLIKQHLQ